MNFIVALLTPEELFNYIAWAGLGVLVVIVAALWLLGAMGIFDR